MFKSEDLHEKAEQRIFLGFSLGSASSSTVLPKSTKQNLFENDNLGQPMSHPSNMPESKDKCQLECQADEFIHSGVKISDFDA